MKNLERTTVQRQQTKNWNFHGGPSQGQQELRGMSNSWAIVERPEESIN